MNISNTQSIDRSVLYLYLLLFCVYLGIEMEAVASKRIKGILLDTTMDSPARSAWLSLRQFNGYSGCQTCTEPGEQLDLGPGKKHARRQCHVYPFNPEYAQTTGHAKLREHDVVKQQALVAMSQISQKGRVVVSILITLYSISISAKHIYFPSHPMCKIYVYRFRNC